MAWSSSISCCELIPPAAINCTVAASQGANNLLRKSLQKSLSIDMRVEKCAAPGIEACYHFQWRDAVTSSSRRIATRPPTASRANTSRSARLLRQLRCKCEIERSSPENSAEPRMTLERLPRERPQQQPRSESRPRSGRATFAQIFEPKRGCLLFQSRRRDRSVAPGEICENRFTHASKVVELQGFLAPCTSWTILPPIKSMEGISMATSPEFLES